MSGSKSWRGAIGRLAAVDPERTAAAVVGLGTVLTVGAVLFGGYVPRIGTLLATTLYPLAVLFPLLGLAVVASAVWWLWATTRPDVSSIGRGAAPETGLTHTTAPVIRETDRALEIAANSRYSCRETESGRDVRARLLEGAVRVVRTRRGLAAETARDRIRSGEWTDDPVAAAFLAAERSQPVPERLRGAVDPGAAYYRRVRRTLDAIERVERTEETGGPIEDGRPEHREVER
ncbi:DUF7269 family protein [Natronococcus pandeyae]|uniref:DUF7269 family protein n=1 Tax=Natronococcus pandeyae TaxID=2055836 RepID=UPI001F3A51B2|nr:hypothetical protein [Natronococcus pandeyae]